MTDLNRLLDRYAEVLLKVGANLQPGQPLVIGGGTERFQTPLTAAGFVQRLAVKAFELGASDVHVNYYDPVLSRLNAQHASGETVSKYPQWKLDRFMDSLERGAAFVMPVAPDPTVFDGVPPERVSAYQKAELTALAPFRAFTSAMAVQWAAGGVATPEWARVVYPDLPVQEAVERLWLLIAKAARADQDDPIAAWSKHLNELRERQTYLNAKQFKRLYYRAPGTDLTVELPDHHAWISGATTKDRNGTPFVPNVPTEEVFTSPKRTGVNGVVRSTLPLNYNGVLVEGITMRFEEGKIVEAKAERGEEALTGMLNTDENARYLGEIALVPIQSPIARMNTVFYSTLYDENASCHLAFGNGFPMALEGAKGLSKEEQLARGVNHSAAHVDFMIGSDQLDIDAETASGEKTPLMRGGSWSY